MNDMNIKYLMVSFAIVLQFTASGCGLSQHQDVSSNLPHMKLIGTVWELKNDAYIVEYHDKRNVHYLVPCLPEFDIRIPCNGYAFDAKRVGEGDSDKRIVGSLRAGETIKISKVIENKNFEIGTTYSPIAIVQNKSKNGRALDACYYYESHPYGLFYQRGILNPDYAKSAQPR